MKESVERVLRIVDFIALRITHLFVALIFMTLPKIGTGINVFNEPDVDNSVYVLWAFFIGFYVSLETCFKVYGNKAFIIMAFTAILLLL